MPLCIKREQSGVILVYLLTRLSLVAVGNPAQRMNMPMFFWLFFSTLLSELVLCGRKWIDIPGSKTDHMVPNTRNEYPFLYHHGLKMSVFLLNFRLFISFTQYFKLQLSAHCAVSFKTKKTQNVKFFYSFNLLIYGILTHSTGEL